MPAEKWQLFIIKKSRLTFKVSTLSNFKLRFIRGEAVASFVTFLLSFEVRPNIQNNYP